MTDQQDSSFVLFARAHLRTEAARAVFGVLADSPERDWTAAAVAKHAGVSDGEADHALRRFGAAGVVERLSEPGRPRRYRWRPEMAYLSRGNAPSGERDPVCGMPVPSDTPHVADDGGRQMRFCSLPCLVLWRTQHRPPLALRPAGDRHDMSGEPR